MAYGRWNPAAVTVVRRSSRISTETRAWLLSDPARLPSSGKKNAGEKEERERQRVAGWRRKKGRGRWFGHGPVWEYLITNIKNTTERLCHIPTVQLQPGAWLHGYNTSYRVSPECTYSTTHTTHAHTVETHLQIHERYKSGEALWSCLDAFFTSKVKCMKCMQAHRYNTCSVVCCLHRLHLRHHRRTPDVKGITEGRQYH